MHRIPIPPTRLKAYLAIFILFCSATLLPTQAVLAESPAKHTAPVLDAMRAELDRSMSTLAQQPDPPYFLSYELTEKKAAQVVGSFGTLTGSNKSRTRQLDIDIRVGDYSLDNTREIRGTQGFNPREILNRYQYVTMPLDDDPATIASLLWYHTDQRYKDARDRLTRVKTNTQVKVEQEDRSADFSREKAEIYLEPAKDLNLDLSDWEDRIRAATAPFGRYGEILQADATLTAEVETRWLVNSDGSKVRTSHPRYRLLIYAMTKADDGMELPRYESFYANNPDDLPNKENIVATAEAMVRDLQALRQAPVVDPYIGPAILSGRAAGVFFHEVFGHRIEGHRQKREREGQTFKKKLGEKILPDNFHVVFDPTVRNYHDKDLAGAYLYDNQGVRARPVKVVDSGIFQSFLMSRTPVEGFDRSNGHGRKQAGYKTVARQSNLLVQVDQPLTRDDLKTQLLERIRDEGKPFGLIFDDIQGGFTITGRTIPNAFNVLPIMVYRVFPDGREELVRGVDLIGTPLTAFSHVIAADNVVGVFNGTCGAESGGVPVAAASPGLLLSQIEVQKKSKSQDRPPILAAPFESEDPTVDSPVREKG